MHKDVYQNDTEHRGGAPNLQAQGGFLRRGGVQAILEDTRFQSIGKQFSSSLS